LLRNYHEILLFKKFPFFMVIITLICISSLSCVSAAGNVTNSTNSTNLADSPWSSYHNDANSTGQSDYNGPQTNTTKWTFNNLTVYGSAVIAADGTVYIGGYDGVLYVFDKDGILQWTWTTRSEILGSPTLGNDGTIYISNWMNSTTYAISSNGTLIWKCNTGDYNFGSSPVIGSDGTIYVAVTNATTGSLCAISNSGTVKWKYTMGLLYGTSPVIGSDGTIYIVDYDGIVYTINPDGTLKWSFRLIKTGTNNRPIYYVSMRYDALSVGPDGTIYVANSGTTTVSGGTPFNWYFLYAIVDNGSSGSVKWFYNNNFNDQSGSPYISILEPIYGAPAISSSGTIYIVSASKIYAISSSGTLLWTYDTGGSAGEGLTSAIIGKDGTIYVGGRNGLFALIDNGSIATLKWHYDTGDIAGSPSIGSDGTLYVGTTTGTFYAFNDLATNFDVDVNKTTVSFSGNTTGTPQSWEWDFGDRSANSTGQNTPHSYTKAGTYTVTLTVTLTDNTILKRLKTVTIGEMDIIPPSVTVNQTGGTYYSPQTASLTATDDKSNATIYCTVDGTDPRSSSTRKIYSGPISITETTTLKFAAVDGAGNWSPVGTEIYTIINIIYVQNASFYGSGTLNTQIQQILDDAPVGSNIVYLGQLYEGLHLIVNKKLFLISTSGTTVSGTDLTAIFLINGVQASGTEIIGFKIINTGSGSGILVNNSSNVTICDVQVTSSSGTAVLINRSTNTTIAISSIINSFNGIEVNKSNNTQILGISIQNNTGEGVIIDSSNNILLNQDQISGNTKRGVRIFNSSNVVVNNSTISTNGQNAGFTSNEGGIFIQGSDQLNITSNQIVNNSQGITTQDVFNTLMDANSIINNFGEGILLTGYARYLTIQNNDIEQNANGIKINYNGNSANVTIQGNTITNNVERFPTEISSGGEDNGDGISFGTEYWLISGEDISHNVILDNQHFDVRAAEALVTPSVGSNWYGGHPHLCPAIKYAPAVYFKIIRTGLNTYTVQFFDGVTNTLVGNMPSRGVTFYSNAFSKSVVAIGGEASTDIPIPELSSNVWVDVDGIKVSSLFDVPVAAGGGQQNRQEGYTGYAGNGNGKTGDGPGTGDGNIPGSASGSGTSGSSSNNGASTGSLAVAAGATASAAGVSSQNQGSGGSQAKTVQELLTNEIKKNPEFWGIIAVILLIIIVIGAYYCKDIMTMIEKSRK
jgi:outer membrane protein assembly factor BamB